MAPDGGATVPAGRAAQTDAEVRFEPERRVRLSPRLNRPSMVRDRREAVEEIPDPRRSLAAVGAAFAKLGIDLPAGIPTGAWRRFDDALLALKAWALGLGFELVLKTAERKPTSRAGAKRRLNCHYYRARESEAAERSTTAKGQHGCSCGFFIYLEESLEGWTILSACFTHSEHYFADPKSERAAQTLAEGSKIPKQLHDDAIKHRRSGGTAEAIDRLLTSEAAHRGLEKTWNNDDIWNAFCRDTAEQTLFDAHHFTQRLRDRERELGLACDFDLEPDGSLRSAFWVAAGGAQRWAQLRSAKVVLYDTKHGTNKYKFKLGCFTIVDENGHTQIIAYSLLPEGEPKQAFMFVFAQFLYHLSLPSVIFTDGDVGMRTAIATTFGQSTAHLLCIYHIYTNFFKHIRKLFGADKSGWRSAVSMFWTIAKKSDLRSRSAFDGEFAELVSAVEASTCLKDSKGENTKDRRLALEWLTTLGTRREQWAARWTWAVLTLDVHSTQRAEATHSALAHIIANSDKLQKLLDKLNLFEQNSSMLKFKKAERLALIQVGPALRPHGRARECAAERAREPGYGPKLGHRAARARACTVLCTACCRARRTRACSRALQPARARSSLHARAARLRSRDRSLATRERVFSRAPKPARATAPRDLTTASSARVHAPTSTHPSAQDVSKTDIIIVRDKLKHILTPYALTRVRKQAALSSQYEVKPYPGHESLALRERTWQVKYLAPQRAADAQRVTAADNEGEPMAEVGDGGLRVPDSVLRADHGLDHNYSCHEVTLESCSCQLPRCSGLPDRHQIAVWQQLLSTGSSLDDIGFNIEDSIAETWLLRNHTEAQVRAAADPSSASRDPLRPAAPY